MLLSRSSYLEAMEKWPFLNEAVGAVVRARRKELNLSKRSLATLAMVERAHIRNIEGDEGNISLNLFFYLADALELEPDDFLSLVKMEMKKHSSGCHDTRERLVVG